MKLNFGFLFCSLFFLQTYAQPLPKNSDYCYRKITTGFGPEDLQIDTITNPNRPRLLIACATRRENEPQIAEIYAHNIDSGFAYPLVRIEPQNTHFNPHGLDLVNVRDSLILLVVSHNDSAKEHSIIRYFVKGDSLFFLQKITNNLFTSPNAVTGSSNGDFWVSNDAGKRGNAFEYVFRQKKSKVIYCKGNDCEIAADKICFGNGILVSENTIYEASTMPGAIYQYTLENGKMTHQKMIIELSGVDNIRLHNGELIVAAHLRFMQFLSHMKNAEKKSPTAIYAVNPTSGEKRLLFFNDGSIINAASTGLVFRNKLYIAQVFDPFILEVDLSCHNAEKKSN
ncbi:MAG TPA: hypothetical protein VGB95_04325 [Chitinophagales bacterium]